MPSFFSKTPPATPAPIAEDDTVTADELKFENGPTASYLNNLVRGFVHKHNNCLTITQGYSELLLSKGGTQDSHPGLIAISKSARSAVNLNARIIACASDDQPTPEPIVLADFLSNRTQKYETLIDQYTLEFEMETGNNSEKVSTDPSWLDLVLNEILLNACQANDANKVTITLATDDLEKALLITIQDDGEGIPKEDLSQVFQPFFSRKGRENLGIGLTRAGCLAGKMGIQITLTSTPKGTTVILTIPQ